MLSSEEKFYETVKPYIEEAIKRPVDQMAVARILQPRTDVLSGIVESLDFIDVLPEYDNAMYIHKKMKTTYEIAFKGIESKQGSIRSLE